MDLMWGLSTSFRYQLPNDALKVSEKWVAICHLHTPLSHVQRKSKFRWDVCHFLMCISDIHRTYWDIVNLVSHKPNVDVIGKSISDVVVWCLVCYLMDVLLSSKQLNGIH